MRRLLVLFTLAAGLASFSVLGVVACGGNDKPPLTPDGVEPTPETAEAGAPGSSSTSSTSSASSAPAATPPAK